ncbi:ABC transporter permease [Oceanivirga salmonicida]|uniref:ABC transporter permease n=1 Tax=Oceanivirga salmonicida TaxID=1769291 RepID=UPI00082E6BFA|nr:ABC transporter permease [Oceanivirga salmonicida]
MSDIYTYLLEHLFLSFTSISLAFIISVPISYLCYKYNYIEKISFFSIQVFRIIPSIAILFILIPIIGVGYVPAIISLVLLALPSLILNMTQGFKNSYDKVKDIPYSLGLKEMYIFINIIFPMSLTQILLGFKLALIEIISSATIATFIGAGGLGTLVFTGLSLNRFDLVLVGTVLISILSISSMLISDYLIKRRKKYD